MTTALHALIQERLADSDSLADDAITLVDAACGGEAELAAALTDLGSSQAPRARPQGFGSKSEPPGVYLSALKVSGFRGIGPERLLEVAPGPGLTLLVGRNGSGKSSFAEGLETLLTGDSRRWAGRPKEWKEGWRNLHAGVATFVEATFTVEGGEPVVLRRVWTDLCALEDSELRVRRGQERLVDLSGLGWYEALQSFRPFLTYAELGAVLSKPSELYDSLKGILGLEQLTAAIGRLGHVRKVCADQQKATKEECKRLRERLGQLTGDERANTCLTALKGNTWQLDVVESQLFGDRDEGVDQIGTLLRQLLAVELPTVDSLGLAVSSLRQALSKLAQLADGGEQRSAELAALLERALSYCDHSATSCPVCGGVLSDEWRRDATTRLAEAQRAAADLREALGERDRCLRRLRELMPAPPAVLRRVGETSVSTKLLDIWTAWAETPADLAALCEHAENGILELDGELKTYRAQVQARLDERESSWKPVARELMAWLDGARKVAAEARSLTALKAAEEWLKTQEEELRDARFEPIEAESRAIWASLRQQSNVDLARIKLDGKATKRHVSLNVSVDGREGVALSVMSQGELNALALSLFLPRMMLAESPFRFLIVDDPVQAMDSHKVDGLARVLEKVAKRRQVIVLTHDPRLLEAIRRLQIEATAIEVTRHQDSIVELVTSRDPVQRHLEDALTVAHNAEPIGPALAPRVVPLFCRLAVEAASKEAIRRRRYGKGQTHDEVEQLIETTTSTHPLVALAIYDDTSRASDVFGYLNKRLGREAGDAFRAIKEGAHGGFSGELIDLVRSCRKIAQELQNIS